MDRLLTQEEQYEAEHEWLFEWSDIPQEYKRDLLKAQDAKTAHLVAQEIIQDYENAFEPTVPMSITYEKHHAIKSKWGIE